MKTLFGQLASHPLAVTEQLDEALKREVDVASRASWLPVALNVQTVEAVAANLGEERGLELLADCVYAQFETPLWRGFIGPAIQLLGASPGALGGWIPRAMQIIFRDCGSWATERTGEDALAVTVHGLPRELANHRLWLRSLGIGMRPLFRICDVDGAADLDGYDPAAGSASFRLSWKLPPG